MKMNKGLHYITSKLCLHETRRLHGYRDNAMYNVQSLYIVQSL